MDPSSSIDEQYVVSPAVNELLQGQRPSEIHRSLSYKRWKLEMEGRQAALPGSVFVIMKTQTSSYLVTYCLIRASSKWMHIILYHTPEDSLLTILRNDLLQKCISLELREPMEAPIVPIAWVHLENTEQGQMWITNQ